MVLDEYAFADKIRTYCLKQGRIDNIECKVLGNLKKIQKFPFGNLTMHIELGFDCKLKKGNKRFRYELGEKEIKNELEPKEEETIEFFLKKIADNSCSINPKAIKDKEIRSYVRTIQQVKSAVEYKTQELRTAFTCSKEAENISTLL